MGATCTKDKFATPKHTGAGGARGDRPGGGGGANAAGRSAQRAGNEKVIEDDFKQCGMMGNNNKNGKPGGGGGGGGISAYKPSEEVAMAYFDYVNELRRVAVATGVLPLRGSNAEMDSTKNNMGSSFTDAKRASDYEVAACPPLTSLTVYQCQPLVGDTVVAKGMYTSVHLARLSVFTGASVSTANAATPRHPVGRRCSGGSSIVFSPNLASTEMSDSISMSGGSASTGNNNEAVSTLLNSDSVSHYIIAMKEAPIYSNYAATLILEQIHIEVRKWARLSAYSSRVLRCYTLEYVYPENVSSAVPEACCHFYPGLSNDEVKTPKANTATSHHSSPISKILELNKSPSGGSSSKRFGSFVKGRKDLSEDATATEASGTPQKLRLYLEYAKYGTLRGYQFKDIPEKFNRRRLHELTARAYMRDVLLALLQVHECGELQYDLCAKSIFLNRPVHTVYGTYFPAYISDVPAGDLASVTPTQLGRALGLLDPPMPQPLSSSIKFNTTSDGRNEVPAPKVHQDPDASGNEPFNGATQNNCSRASSPKGIGGSPTGRQPNVRDSGAYNVQAEISVMTHNESAMPQALSTSEAKLHNNHLTTGSPSTMLEQRDGVYGGCSAGDAYKMSQDDAPSPASVATPLRPDSFIGSSKHRFGELRSLGQPTSTNSLRTTGYVEGDDATDHQRLNEVYCRYIDEFEFKRTNGDEVPFPSPHDGIEAQVDAELLATTMLHEEPRATPAMRVMALQRSNLGGVAIISPDHFVVKPKDSPGALEPRGRLPMILSASTDTSVLVCGNPHTTAPTFSPVPVSHNNNNHNLSTLPLMPLTHTMSSGTTMVDAAGALGRARGGVPLTKLNHTSLIRRALAYGDADKLEDVPIHKYVTVTHAAPEVLRRRAFSSASDIYAFAITFIELVTDDGAIMEECLPQGLPKPKTRREKEEYDVQLTANLDKWYQTRLNALRQNLDAVTKEQEMPASLSPRAGPIVVRVPEHLSDEARNMLRWCLQHDPRKRPTAAELLHSRYFMLGDWIAAPTVQAAENGATKPPEKPWDTTVSFDAAARAIGLPLLQE